jgi:predicted  nucleic acid-binding Zn-ribbon protein
VVLLARDVSVRLAQELEGIERQFMQLSTDIQQHRSRRHMQRQQR